MAHELLHSIRPLDKALSNILLCSVGYMHWTCSHLAHHRNVSSPINPKMLLTLLLAWEVQFRGPGLVCKQHAPFMRTSKILLCCDGYMLWSSSHLAHHHNMGVPRL